MKKRILDNFPLIYLKILTNSLVHQTFKLFDMVETGFLQLETISPKNGLKLLAYEI